MSASTSTKFLVQNDVKSYECDIQGIVNNAVYLNYLEYARHEFLKSKGLDFVKLHEEGRDLVVVRHELDYKSPLRSDESFRVEVEFSKTSKVKWQFIQDIYRNSDDKHIMHAVTTGTCLSNGRPSECVELEGF